MKKRIVVRYYRGKPLKVICYQLNLFLAYEKKV